jgi:hypothetical protein
MHAGGPRAHTWSGDDAHLWIIDLVELSTLSSPPMTRPVLTIWTGTLCTHIQQ